jgi:electron transfer flavoprotein alpha subunit
MPTISPSRRRADRALAPGYRRTSCSPATSRGKNVAARRRLLDVAQVSDIIKVERPTPSSGRSTPATRSQTVQSKTPRRSSPCARPTFEAARDGGSAPVENAARRRPIRPLELRRRGESPRATAPN